MIIYKLYLAQTLPLKQTKCEYDYCRHKCHRSKKMIRCRLICCFCICLAVTKQSIECDRSQYQKISFPRITVLDIRLSFLIVLLIKNVTPQRVNMRTPIVIKAATIIFLGFNFKLDPFWTLLKYAPTITTIKYRQFRPKLCSKYEM